MVVPVFYGTYTALGLVNTIIYLDEVGNYPPWAIVLVFVGIGVLIYGVTLLSSKSDPAHLPEAEEELQTVTSPHWLSANEEKTLENTDITENSSSSSNCEKSNGFFEKIKKNLGPKKMSTFLSLHSQTTKESNNK